MKQLRISEKAVRSYGIQQGLYSMRVIAESAGLGPNTLYRYETFKSSTVDSLANFFGCNPLDLMEVVEVEDPKAVALLSQPEQMRMPIPA